MRLRELREINGFTQKELGEILMVEQNTVSQWETGERTPRAAMLIKLADILGCTLDELLREDAS